MIDGRIVNAFYIELEESKRLKVVKNCFNDTFGTTKVEVSESHCLLNLMIRNSFAFGAAPLAKATTAASRKTFKGP